MADPNYYDPFAYDPRWEPQSSSESEKDEPLSMEQGHIWSKDPGGHWMDATVVSVDVDEDGEEMFTIAPNLDPFFDYPWLTVPRSEVEHEALCEWENTKYREVVRSLRQKKAEDALCAAMEHCSTSQRGQTIELDEGEVWAEFEKVRDHRIGLVAKKFTQEDANPDEWEEY